MVEKIVEEFARRKVKSSLEKGSRTTISMVLGVGMSSFFAGRH
jgi:hypothetical protein